MKFKLEASVKSKLHIVGMVLVVVAVAGTLAWQSFSQMALNESTQLLYSPGGRLHDDFDGVNKDVYIENYAVAYTGEKAYARIQLAEYLEYGEGAGLIIDEDEVEDGLTRSQDMVILRGDKQNQEETPDIADESTWDTYLFGSTVSDSADTEVIRNYRDLAFGGSTLYMPTFNLDINCIEADINGTYAEPDEISDGREHYDDYRKYFLGETVTTQAKYAYRDLGGVVENPVEGTHYYYREETHQTQRTLTSLVISMEKWKEMGSPTGQYWVYDVDGWAYWADAIMPQTATGLLLDKIEVVQETKGDWFYSVYVIAQIATAGDWGEGTVASEGVASSGIGMYAGGITQDGLDLLNKVSGLSK